MTQGILEFHIEIPQGAGMTENSRIPMVEIAQLGQGCGPRMAQKRVGLLDICALRGWLARDRAVFLI